MKLAETESGHPQRIKNVLMIIGLVVAIVIVVAVASEVYLPGLFGRSQTVNSTWVTDFVNGIDAVRVSQGNSSLTFEDNLTTFAQLIATNLTSHYENPFLGFKNELAEFFGPAAVVMEAIIIPGDYSPAFQVKYTQQNIPITWEEFLTSTAYGYAIADSPYYSITNQNQCKISFIPPNTANITQYLESQGCQFKITNTAWVIFELTK